MIRNIIDIQEKVFSNDRRKLRNEVINLFLEEEPGFGKGDLTSRYDYIIKKLPENKIVYLRRPAILNNGLDFTLNVSNTDFNYYLQNKRRSTRPTHNNIKYDLSIKKAADFQLYKELFKQIELIYNCQNPTKTNFDFNIGHSTELILECIKWLFIEQEVTYWHNSGRMMFFEGIKKI